MDLKTLAAAAEAVHLSVPALSRSLRALEDALRVPLFDRSDRRLRPTPYAVAYVDRARRMVFDEREGARALALMRAGEGGSLAFGMGSSLANSLLAPMMLRLQADAPGLRLKAIVHSTDVLHDALVKEQLDFFVGDVRIAAGRPDLTAEPVHACVFGWFARTGHPLATNRRIDFAALSAFPLVAAGYADESIERRVVELYGLKAPFADHFAIDTSDLATVQALLTSSDAIAPSTDVAFASALHAGTVVPLDVVPRLDLELTLGIVRRTGRTLVPASEQAFVLVRRFFAEAGGLGARLRARAPSRPSSSPARDRSASSSPRPARSPDRGPSGRPPRPG
jgi:DNA-binding transcriptional LysR family regulator